jgi:hypothetical protein
LKPLGAGYSPKTVLLEPKSKLSVLKLIFSPSAVVWTGVFKSKAEFASPDWIGWWKSISNSLNRL